ncbi:uncharacterized protein H6S33_005178 [Morchella sextelata]|uniref:uncharacterized protein n=1 Tax=Morchella sextelata TaxID=1174677 RepID=UPI001D046316|nr:uncharacterized protein H6S33_005178 [Morchella sextelata]KAH0605196.1 hypothetical protein H6S33_005178 [Morchella sextelata]
MTTPAPTTDTTTPHLQDLVQTVHKNLQHLADWSSLVIHSSPSFPRPLITGLPPDPVYIDPDSASAYNAEDKNSPERSQHEWVLPVDLREKWTLRKWAQVFDSLPEGYWGESGGKMRGKRILLAVVSDDSTVVHYVVHDGIVKPRQN